MKGFRRISASFCIFATTLASCATAIDTQLPNEVAGAGYVEHFLNFSKEGTGQTTKMYMSARDKAGKMELCGYFTTPPNALIEAASKQWIADAYIESDGMRVIGLRNLRWRQNTDQGPPIAGCATSTHAYVPPRMWKLVGPRNITVVQ